MSKLMLSSVALLGLAAVCAGEVYAAEGGGTVTWGNTPAADKAASDACSAAKAKAAANPEGPAQADVAAKCPAAAVNTPNPAGSNAAVPTPTPVTPADIAKQAQESLMQVLGGGTGINSGLSGFNMQGMLAQIGQNMLSQQLQQLMSGKQNGSSGSGSSDYSDTGTDYNGNPVCDRVTGTKSATEVGASSGVTITTVVTTSNCANGRSKVSTAIKLEYPDGKVINHNNGPVVK